MSYDTNGQPLGVVLDDWRGAQRPQAITLEGRFCRIEPFCLKRYGTDLRAALALDKTGEGWAYLPMPAPTSEADWAQWFTTMETSRDDPRYFAIIDLQREQAVGISCYQRIDPTNGVIEVARLQFSPLLQRKPAATEAMYLMMRQAFEWGYRRYEWKCNALNSQSRRAAERLGFTFEGIFRQHLVNKGLNRDTAWFSVLDREWPLVRCALEAWLVPGNFDLSGKQRCRLEDYRRALADSR